MGAGTTTGAFPTMCDLDLFVIVTLCCDKEKKREGVVSTPRKNTINQKQEIVPRLSTISFFSVDD